MFRAWFILVLAAGLIAARGADSAPIAQRDGLVWATVDCAGTPLHFVVDTGAASSCLDLAAARRLGVRLGTPVNVVGVCGRATGYVCAGFEGTIGGMRLPGQVVALDLSGPAQACSQSIDGLIGADFFRGKVVRIDYARGLIERIDRQPATGTPLRFANGVMCAPVAVDGGAVRWTRVDTGCTDALDWCERVGARRPAAGKSVALAWLHGEALVADVTVGSAALHDLPVKVRGREIFPGEAGLLGNGALSKYRVTIDGIGRRLVLERLNAKG